jgi:dTDP-4-dehydrorhamnose reductase
MRALITGAGGMLGRDVAHACETRGMDVAAYTRADLDIADVHAVNAVVAAERPDVVFNCAAYTDVDGAEADEAGAMKVNADAAGVVARAVSAQNAALVHLSTDYVFDGKSHRPYNESDLPSPIQAYGRSKLAGEIEVARNAEHHFIVRSSWLFGEGGSNFVKTMLRVGREHGEARVVDDQVGSPTFTGHLAAAVAALAETDAYGVHHIAGAGACSWHGFAAAIFEEAAVEVDLSRCATEDFPRPARRPRYSVLETERSQAFALPDWRDGLAEYLTHEVIAR